jgi:transposase-like protein
MEEYPKTLAELEKLFATDEACRKYLFSMRWPEGFVCPKCGGRKMWSMANGLVLCRLCRSQISIMQGTIFQDSHLPLLTWFRAMWYICVQKNGISALGLQRALGVGSYRTAWMCLHKLRHAMVRPSRDKLSGVVELDETFLGGEKTGKRGRGAAGKSMVLIAAECDGPGIGRIRMSHIPKVSQNAIKQATKEMIEEHSKIISDKWSQYVWLKGAGYEHESVYASIMLHTGKDPLPRCHRVASLLKRWVLGTMQGAFDPKHLPEYLNEFTFRFNRRRSASRGKLFYRLVQQAMQVDAVPYKEITKTLSVVDG